MAWTLGPPRCWACAGRPPRRRLMQRRRGGLRRRARPRRVRPRAWTGRQAAAAPRRVPPPTPRWSTPRCGASLPSGVGRSWRVEVGGGGPFRRWGAGPGALPWAPMRHTCHGTRKRSRVGDLAPTTLPPPTPSPAIRIGAGHEERQPGPMLLGPHTDTSSEAGSSVNGRGASSQVGGVGRGRREVETCIARWPQPSASGGATATADRVYFRPAPHQEAALYWRRQPVPAPGRQHGVAPTLSFTV